MRAFEVESWKGFRVHFKPLQEVQSNATNMHISKQYKFAYLWQQNPKFVYDVIYYLLPDSTEEIMEDLKKLIEDSKTDDEIYTLLLKPILSKFDFNKIFAEKIKDTLRKWKPLNSKTRLDIGVHDIIDILPFDNSEFDLITCFTVIHHVECDKLQTFVKELRRIMKKGGTIILIEYHCTSYLSTIMLTLVHELIQTNKIKNNFNSRDYWCQLFIENEFIRDEKNMAGVGALDAYIESFTAI